MPPDTATVARLLRRTGFGPAPGEVESHASLADARATVLAGAVDDGAEMPDPRDEDLDPAITWWLRRMRRTTAPLHDKLVLFWHSNLTSSGDKASADMMVRQHNLIRRHALGSFRDLLGAVVTDAAMLVFLDADGSSAEAPNENLARELMELFALGRGAYTEADVRAGAVALAGFRVDWDSEAVGFDEDVAATGPVTVLGHTEPMGAARLLDIVCEQPTCAEFVTAKLFRYLVGSDPSAARLDALATTFRDSGLDIAALVEAIVGGDEITEGDGRVRWPIEWYIAAHQALGLDVDPEGIWLLYDLGQMPLYPPNVAGWPLGTQWANAGRQVLKASSMLDAFGKAAFVDFGGGSATERATAALARCGVYDPSATTVAALAAAVGTFDAGGIGDGDRMLLALALTSPEASCA
ncbi:MAG: DUF1800 family protein [Desertimonas sp.]